FAYKLAHGMCRNAYLVTSDPFHTLRQISKHKRREPVSSLMKLAVSGSRGVGTAEMYCICSEQISRSRQFDLN
ncbi:MAG: hypothetical protein KKG78_02235, partial [Alphaproteobacteria bacterium]|nr:hypothetical protein [Alphaproteobacteria bacterium]